MEQSPAWQGELSQRVEAYRTRRRRLAPNAAQSQFSFEDPPEDAAAYFCCSCGVSWIDRGRFLFTIAIGRPSKKLAADESRMVIDGLFGHRIQNLARNTGC